MAFRRLQTQWLISATGHRTGLVYSSIKPVCKALGIKYNDETFAGIQIMETATINEVAKRGRR